MQWPCEENKEVSVLYEIADGIRLQVVTGCCLGITEDYTLPAAARKLLQECPYTEEKL